MQWEHRGNDYNESTKGYQEIQTQSVGKSDGPAAGVHLSGSGRGFSYLYADHETIGCFF